MSVVVHDASVRVLVVEDHGEVARDSAQALRDRGIATELACDGAAALHKGAVFRDDGIGLDRDRQGVHGDAGDAGGARVLMLDEPYKGVTVRTAGTA